MSFFEKYKSGELSSRLSSDINQAKSAVSNNVTFLIRSILIVIGNMVILVLINWKLSICIIALVPIYGIFTRQYIKRSRVLVRKNQDVQAEISANVV